MIIRTRLAEGANWPYPVDYEREVVPPPPPSKAGGHRPRRFNDEEAEQVRAKIKKLGSLKAVAHYYGCSTDLITAVRDKTGVYQEN